MQYRIPIKINTAFDRSELESYLRPRKFGIGCNTSVSGTAQLQIEPDGDTLFVSVEIEIEEVQATAWLVEAGMGLATELLLDNGEVSLELLFEPSDDLQTLTDQAEIAMIVDDIVATIEDVFDVDLEEDLELDDEGWEWGEPLEDDEAEGWDD